MSRFFTCNFFDYEVIPAENGYYYIKPINAEGPVLQTNETGLFIWQTIGAFPERNTYCVSDEVLAYALKKQYASEEGFTEEGLLESVIHWVDCAIEVGCVMLVEAIPI